MGGLNESDNSILDVASRNAALTIHPRVSLLFISHALIYFNNTAFRLKFVFMFFAAVNMLIFELVTRREVGQWDLGGKIPPAARLAGALSLIFWMASVYLGRQTGWTMDAF